MPDSGDTKGFEPAPWEAPGKRHTKIHSAGQPAPQNPGGYPPAPQRPPTGQAPAPAYPQPSTPDPQAAPQHPPAYPPPGGAPQPYPQQQYPPPPPGAPQYGAPGPYGYDMAAYAHRPQNSVMAIISMVVMGVGILVGLVTVGIGGAPFFLAGVILGALALRETGAGKKSGRGLAMAGTIVNSLGLLGSVALFAAFMWLFSYSTQKVEEATGLQADTQLIIQRVGQYESLKGDLHPGGPKVIRGIRSQEAVVGSLKVSDLVSPTELKFDMSRYTLEVNASAGTAKLFYTDEDGTRRQMETYPMLTPRFDRDFQFE